MAERLVGKGKALTCHGSSAKELSAQTELEESTVWCGAYNHNRDVRNTTRFEESAVRSRANLEHGFPDVTDHTHKRGACKLWVEELQDAG